MSSGRHPSAGGGTRQSWLVRIGRAPRCDQNLGKRCDGERLESSMPMIGVCRDETPAHGARASMNSEHHVAWETDPQWPARLRREVLWLVAAKLAALMLIWALFFRK